MNPCQDILLFWFKQGKTNKQTKTQENAARLCCFVLNVYGMLLMQSPSCSQLPWCSRRQSSIPYNTGVQEKPNNEQKNKILLRWEDPVSSSAPFFFFFLSVLLFMTIHFPKWIYLPWMLTDITLYHPLKKLNVMQSLCLSSAYCLFSCEAVWIAWYYACILSTESSL